MLSRVMAKNIAQWFSSIGGTIAVVMPKGLCPICVAASGGMLASLGLGFLAVERNVRILLAITLSFAIAGLVLSARRHRRWWTIPLGAVAAVTVLVGRLLLINTILYSGMVLLVGAMGADLWARRHPWAPLVQLRLKRG